MGVQNKTIIVISLLLFFLSGIHAIKDIKVWQGQYYTNTTFNEGTYVFNFSVYDARNGGNLCYTNTTNITTGTWGEWKSEQSGVWNSCNNMTKSYFLNININGTNQGERRRLTSLNYLRNDDSIFLDTNDNVGIGTTKPDSKLDVNGTLIANKIVNEADNVVMVQSESDLPSAQSGEIQLKNNTVYYFNGFITSTNSLVLGKATPLVGSHGSTDGFIYLGGGTAIKSKNNSFFMRDLYVHAPGGTLFNLSADLTKEILVESSAFSDAANLGNIANLGTVEGFRAPSFKGVNFEEFDSGLTFTGQSDKIFISSTPMRTITNSGVTLLTFDNNFETNIVDLANNYIKGVQADTKVIDVKSGATINEIFQYRGVTHDSTINESLILNGKASVGNVGFRVRDSYPLKDTAVTGTIISNLSSPQLIDGSGSGFKNIHIPTNIFNFQKINMSENSTLQYIGKKNIDLGVIGSLVITGVATDNVEIMFKKNNQSIGRQTTRGSLFNANSFTTIDITETIAIERYDNITLAIENIDGPGDISVQQISLTASSAG